MKFKDHRCLHQTNESSSSSVCHFIKIIQAKFSSLTEASCFYAALQTPRPVVCSAPSPKTCCSLWPRRTSPPTSTPGVCLCRYSILLLAPVSAVLLTWYQSLVVFSAPQTTRTTAEPPDWSASTRFCPQTLMEKRSSSLRWKVQPTVESQYNWSCAPDTWPIGFPLFYKG